jgi:hypothetical protein
VAAASASAPSIKLLHGMAAALLAPQAVLHQQGPLLASLSTDGTGAAIGPSVVEEAELRLVGASLETYQAPGQMGARRYPQGVAPINL